MKIQATKIQGCWRTYSWANYYAVKTSKLVVPQTGLPLDSFLVHKPLWTSSFHYFQHKNPFWKTPYLGFSLNWHIVHYGATKSWWIFMFAFWWAATQENSAAVWLSIPLMIWMSVLALLGLEIITAKQSLQQWIYLMTFCMMMKSKWNLFNFPCLYSLFKKNQDMYLVELVKYEDTNQSAQGIFL